MAAYGRFRTLVFYLFLSNIMGAFLILQFLYKNHMDSKCAKSYRTRNYTTRSNTTISTAETFVVDIEHKIDYGHKEEFLCPDNSGLQLGDLTIDLQRAENVYKNLTSSTKNGSWSDGKYLGPSVSVTDGTRTAIVFQPKRCRPTYSTAIIIPFRYREEHLRYLLGHLIPVLQRQLIRFSIFVVAQFGDGMFNKGRLMNTGFEYASKAGNNSGLPFDCFIFHDVDLLVEHDTLKYRCMDANEVHHISPAIDKFNYKRVCCGMTVGGVLAMNEEQFRKINGYSNAYAGWGGEDDDMNFRLRNKNITIRRPEGELGRFTMVTHKRDKGNPNNSKRHGLLANAKERADVDGLSDLKTRIVEIQFYPLFTNIVVDVETD